MVLVILQKLVLGLDEIMIELGEININLVKVMIELGDVVINLRAVNVELGDVVINSAEVNLKLVCYHKLDGDCDKLKRGPYKQTKLFYNWGISFHECSYDLRKNRCIIGEGYHNLDGDCDKLVRG